VQYNAFTVRLDKRMSILFFLVQLVWPNSSRTGVFSTHRHKGSGKSRFCSLRTTMIPLLRSELAFSSPSPTSSISNRIEQHHNDFSSTPWTATGTDSGTDTISGCSRFWTLALFISIAIRPSHCTSRATMNGIRQTSSSTSSYWLWHRFHVRQVDLER